MIVGKVHACGNGECLAGNAFDIEALRRPQDLRSQKAKDKHRQSHRTVPIDSSNGSLSLLVWQVHVLQCASAAIADESVLNAPAAFLSSLASG